MIMLLSIFLSKTYESKKRLIYQLIKVLKSQQPLTFYYTWKRIKRRRHEEMTKCCFWQKRKYWEQIMSEWWKGGCSKYEQKNWCDSGLSFRERKRAGLRMSVRLFTKIFKFNQLYVISSWNKNLYGVKLIGPQEN